MIGLDIIHPDDASAMNALKNVPGLQSLMEKAFQYGYDELIWSNNVTSNLRLSEKQMPEIYNHLPPICEKLGIPIPELYLQMSPIPNAWTSGNSRVFIVLTRSLIRRLTDEELNAVLAHECGHILCQHVLYATLASIIFDFGDTLVDSLFGTIGNIAMKPIKQALFAWNRASELSADRVACLVTSAETLSRALAKLEGIPNFIVDNMDIDEWAKQGCSYEELKNSDTWHKAIRYLSNMNLNHPYGAVRAYEAKLWEDTDNCKLLRDEKVLQIGITGCPQCGSPINPDWTFCKSCGNKLK